MLGLGMWNPSPLVEKTYWDFVVPASFNLHPMSSSGNFIHIGIFMYTGKGAIQRETEIWNP